MTRVRLTKHSFKYTWHANLSESVHQQDRYRTIVIGVGEAGSNTVVQLTEMNLVGVKCIVVDTGDGKSGRTVTKESMKHVEDSLSNADIVFITSGLDNRKESRITLTIAEMARRKGLVVIGVLATLFRSQRSENGNFLAEMRRQCDTVLVMDIDKLATLVPHLSKSEAFKVVDQVLANTLRGIVETISGPNLISLEFPDFKTIVRQGGVAAVGIGESDAPNRAEDAVRNALSSPLLGVDCTGATGALVNVTGDSQMTIEEANRVGEIITEMMGANTLVMWSAKVNPQQQGKLKVTLVMTGINPPNSSRALGKIAPQLFDLESSSLEPQKSLDVDLELYQMENF